MGEPRTLFARVEYGCRRVERWLIQRLELRQNLNAVKVRQTNEHSDRKGGRDPGTRGPGGPLGRKEKRKRAASGRNGRGPNPRRSIESREGSGGDTDGEQSKFNRFMIRGDLQQIQILRN